MARASVFVARKNRLTQGTSNRRRPQQPRAEATVDAIVQATARLLIEDGYDRISTNSVARAAGVSIGSLYRYFPNKEILVAFLAQTHFDRMRAALGQTLASQPGGRLVDRARMLVLGVIAAHRVDPALHRVLSEEVPKRIELRDDHGFEQHVAEVCRSSLLGPGEPTRRTDPDRTAFLFAHALSGAIRAAVEADPDAHDDAQLADELTNVVVRYLAVAAPEGMPSRADQESVKR